MEDTQFEDTEGDAEALQKHLARAESPLQSISFKFAAPKSSAADYAAVVSKCAFLQQVFMPDEPLHCTEWFATVLSSCPAFTELYLTEMRTEAAITQLTHLLPAIPHIRLLAMRYDKYDDMPSTDCMVNLYEQIDQLQSLQTFTCPDSKILRGSLFFDQRFVRTTLLNFWHYGVAEDRSEISALLNFLQSEHVLHELRIDLHLVSKRVRKRIIKAICASPTIKRVGLHDFNAETDAVLLTRPLEQLSLFLREQSRDEFVKALTITPAAINGLEIHGYNLPPAVYELVMSAPLTSLDIFDFDNDPAADVAIPATFVNNWTLTDCCTQNELLTEDDEELLQKITDRNERRLETICATTFLVSFFRANREHEFLNSGFEVTNYFANFCVSARHTTASWLEEFSATLYFNDQLAGNGSRKRKR